MIDLSNNGILGSVDGPYIAAATAKLPHAATAPDTIHEIEIDAGRIRPFARRQQARHHKHSHWYWSAFRAEPAE
ncbi:MAG TPA: hypothetical protein VL003_11775 [Pusillimonas sp.]|uniref:hypothetical protein n=1 Tax=Pusillimonas sp. TaxID=3040095 RepID=UPI002CFA515F|nr:hypothetical protein [Pusillimonas sp.]HUH88708.1 hypothetical protein [Pusillimonas sp.]